eukprot:Unigene15840_Nuclearia_a/m.47163 Unigene15840_Nuclearia_a/g.47163  ORF Unigene15840_Nuclearia_a/g.47163 Unigene15840_Nuclearia_a/m.47163 type:complete len:267 (-) Unigene15840_Nuclearia_a:92-892(-)
MVATTRLYFAGTYRLQCAARIVATGSAGVSGKPEDAQRPYIVLDQTVCHPQGGGQPSDVGTITTDAGAVFAVSDVRTDREHDQILHFGSPLVPADMASFATDTPVTVRVDEATRRLHARLHSAGHLLDSALNRLGVLQQYDLKPTKGHHFPSGANVEYAGVLPPEAVEQVQRQLQAEMDRLVREDVAVEVFLDVPPAKVAELCCTSAFEAGGEAEHASVRVVRMAGLGCPCGGTHVERLGELGQVTITKVKSTPKKREVKVSYVLG